MKKLIVFLSIAVSVLVFSAQAMDSQFLSPEQMAQAAFSEAVKSQPHTPAVSSSPSLEQIEQAAYNGALRAQPSFLGGTAKKAGYGVLICIAGYLVVRYVIGMPTLAHVKKEVACFINTTKNKIETVFGTIRTSLANLKTRFEEMNNKVGAANTKIVSLTKNLQQQNQDLETANQNIKKLIAIANQCELLNGTLHEEIHNLVRAICNAMGKEVLLQKISRLIEEQVEGSEKLTNLKKIIQEIK